MWLFWVGSTFSKMFAKALKILTPSRKTISKLDNFQQLLKSKSSKILSNHRVVMLKNSLQTYIWSFHDEHSIIALFPFYTWFSPNIFLKTPCIHANSTNTRCLKVPHQHIYTSMYWNYMRISLKSTSVLPFGLNFTDETALVWPARVYLSW